ncbi:hypothetical protein Nepgr_013023 [Nepenthes gracilis]|uniref:Uncharacterized protein n=1 Tax=Nepenthes gracilis TaxID=150966 RepID=A0AAD3SH87_NEPGR|nr:hypothetical protein Nepgr_013023 [Nepenthes gracilis]
MHERLSDSSSDAEANVAADKLVPRLSHRTTSFFAVKCRTESRAAQRSEDQISFKLLSSMYSSSSHHYA